MDKETIKELLRHVRYTANLSGSILVFYLVRLIHENGWYVNFAHELISCIIAGALLIFCYVFVQLISLISIKRLFHPTLLVYAALEPGVSADGNDAAFSVFFAIVSIIAFVSLHGIWH